MGSRHGKIVKKRHDDDGLFAENQIWWYVVTHTHTHTPLCFFILFFFNTSLLFLFNLAPTPLSSP